MNGRIGFAARAGMASGAHFLPQLVSPFAGEPHLTCLIAHYAVAMIPDDLGLKTHQASATET